MEFSTFLINPQKYISRYPYLGEFLINKQVSFKQYTKYPDFEFIEGKIDSIEEGYITIKPTRSENKKKIGLFSCKAEMEILKIKNIDSEFLQSFSDYCLFAGCMMIREALSAYISLFESGRYSLFDTEELRNIFHFYNNFELLLPESFVSEIIIKKRLINYFPDDILFNIFTNQCVQNDSSDFYLSEYWEKYKSHLISLLVRAKNDDYWKKLPDNLKDDKVFFEFAPIKIKFEKLISSLKSYTQDSIDLIELQNLVLILKQSKNLSFWELIPVEFLSFSELWNIAPQKNKLQYIISLIDSKKQLSSEQHDELLRIIKTTNQKIIWEKIPSSILTMNEFWKLAPAEKKYQFLISGISNNQDSRERNQLIHKLKELLIKENKFVYWDKLPLNIFIEPVIIKNSPINVLKKKIDELTNPIVTGIQINNVFDFIPLNNEDLFLASQWLETNDSVRIFIEQNKTNSNLAEELTFQFGQNKRLMLVLSARAAEKAVKEFFTRIGKNVIDVSLGQIKDPENFEWKRYDLKVDEKAIDVKNARASKHNKSLYVDHFVLKQKYTTGGIPVLIAGVLSQYLWPESLLSQNIISANKDRKVRFLGLVDLESLSEVAKHFDSTRLKIDLKRNYNETGDFLPPWAFDFLLELYRVRGKVIESLRPLNKLLPVFGKVTEYEIFPFMLATMDSDSIEELNIAVWEHMFLLEFIKWPYKERLSLPYIYLSVLNHFINMVFEENPDDQYSPEKYKKLLYLSEDKVDNPVFVYDPLHTIANLIETLQRIWEEKREIIKKFKKFKLSKLNIFRGYSEENNMWMTILAYCGDSYCRYTPLVMGKHINCSSCGKLICPACGLCDVNCKEFISFGQIPKIDDIPKFRKEYSLEWYKKNEPGMIEIPYEQFATEYYEPPEWEDPFFPIDL